MFSLLGWVVIGLIAGALARLLIPGRQSMGIFMTMLLGIVGSFVGGFISSLIFGRDPMEPTIHGSGLIMSTIGAVVLLGLYVAYARRRAV
jgi:uncharacterized membrane protein YeaQ/YmgE (transglycosylase-associated protein family)